ncbi:hypothetical protein RUMHYD_03821 [Blautia hydrogenotrophica DSM 10507]|uniref:Uncharacterized protein n=1 Tax=Blautia hydrogenotrophica (strain DSM 10507 / JCM 14656 / S5a33) TaxID=476272 RepID=C0CSF4_BLAHS|nr:hypothetical protein RUMHYD_03821 [Blautia hydrogenotrophica DSM 10507]
MKLISRLYRAKENTLKTNGILHNLNKNGTSDLNSCTEGMKVLSIKRNK